VEAGCDEGEVERADEDLRGRQLHAGHLDRPAEDMKRLAHQPCKSDIHGGHSEARARNRQQDRLAQSQDRLGETRAHQDRNPCQRDKSKADRRPAEHDDLGDLGRAQALARIEPVADGPAAERRETDIVPHREAYERRQRHLRIRKRPVDVAQGEIIEPGKTEIARRGPADRRQEMRNPHRQDGGEELFGFVMAERPV
jgi:hypothetical protein